MRKILVLLLCLAAPAFGAAPPNVGDKAPDFTAAANTGPVHLAGLIGKQYIILYFYPKDFTGG